MIALRAKNLAATLYHPHDAHKLSLIVSLLFPDSTVFNTFYGYKRWGHPDEHRSDLIAQRQRPPSKR